MTEQTCDSFSARIVKYPYDSDERLSLIENILTENETSKRVKDFMEECSLFLPSRVVLYYLIKNDTSSVEISVYSTDNFTQTSIYTPDGTARANGGDRTEDLIDSYLSMNPAEKPHRKLTLADASTDYAAWLEQNESIEKVGENTQVPVIPSLDIGEKDIENLIRNGDYKHAIEIMQGQLDANSKKSCYFADRIRFLNKVIQLKQD